MKTVTDTFDAGRLIQILQHIGSGRYTLNRLDVRTREEQRIGVWGQDDTANTGIDIFAKPLDVIISEHLEDLCMSNFTVCRFGNSEKHCPSSTRADFMEKPVISKLAILDVLIRNQVV